MRDYTISDCAVLSGSTPFRSDLFGNACVEAMEICPLPSAILCPISICGGLTAVTHLCTEGSPGLRSERICRDLDTAAAMNRMIVRLDSHSGSHVDKLLAVFWI